MADCRSILRLATRAAATLAAAMLVAAAVGARSAGAADARPASQPDSPGLGRIEGELAPPGEFAAVKCIDREYKLDYAADFDPATGRLDVRQLPPGRRYDLELTTRDGRRLIGVNLAYEEDALLRLARRQGDDEERPGPLTDEDRRQIEQIVVKIETFENERRIMALRGDHAGATALVELRRTGATIPGQRRTFHSAKPGEEIRRVEIWHFKFQHGGWEKIANAEKVLSRVRAQRAAIQAQIERERYVPELGGLLVEADRPTRLVFRLPDSQPPSSQPTNPREEQP